MSCSVRNTPTVTQPPATPTTPPPVQDGPQVQQPTAQNTQGTTKPGNYGACVDAAALERTLNQALGGLTMMALGAAMLKGAQSLGAQSCCQCLPPPQATPQGGLQVGNVPGFPENAIRTQGGYTIVPEGKDQAWKIYGPGQSASDEALTRVWGDPHVNEADGTRWDFTKDSNFALPDGTVIRCDTTSETGKSVTQGLTIVSGNDRVEVRGVNSNKPTTFTAKDGQTWLNDNSPTLMASNTFMLQHNGKDVNWFRSTNGEIEGLVTGARSNVDGKGSYDQILDTSRKSATQQPAAQSASLDMNNALALFGMMALGGLGFLGGDQISGFMQQVGTALSALFTQSSLSSLFSQNQAAAGVRV